MNLTSGTGFPNDTELVKFARQFLANNIKRFKKDIDVCLTHPSLTPAGKPRIAYFPAVATCAAFWEFAAGLYIGEAFSKLPGVKIYSAKFLDNNAYPEQLIDVFYRVLRHKVAHLAHPYYVTIGSKSEIIVWKVDARHQKTGLELAKLPHPQLIPQRHQPPWDTLYDHEFVVSIPTLRDDLIKSIEQRYLPCLETDRKLQENFSIVIKMYFPP